MTPTEVEDDDVEMTTQLDTLWLTDTQRVSDGRLTRTDFDNDVETTTQLERLWSTDTQSVGWAFDTNRR